VSTATVVCSKLKRRIQFDLKRGHTTSESAKDFVRRTCKCDECTTWRRGQMHPSPDRLEVSHVPVQEAPQHLASVGA
jgi:hypothetical protein